MPWTSVSRRLSILSPRKRADYNESLPPRIEAPQSSLVAEFPPRDLPVIPPELWLQIIDFLPFESLWLVRRTCRLFQFLALVRAWELIRDTEVGVRTYFDSQHDPLSYISAAPQLLSPSIPKSLSMDLHRTAIDDPVIRDSRKATWRVVEERQCDCQGLRFSYRPYTVEILFPSNIRAGYNVERPKQVCGPMKDLIRIESWSIGSNPTSNSSKFAKFFSKSDRYGSSPWPRYKGPTPEWNMDYVAEYGLGRNDDGELVHQLEQLMLREVTLPVTQVVCTFIDALKYSDSTIWKEA